eukprot:CAMPEP_0197659764 /NCGR_PEP_ID=MMETSP1338-20131121/48987_1 /TAXON_ID=43686 ORGANISM="Pelagodinium beii, Strain RCC1491" /NCGR_SAMPLE_ID=MMETSP1338 /ASSEMBLY_ACC=CAM_ASM_000754 /LENGTH=272 /DNA_ID=CAMNT_0043236849 /DNA_START=40 /DNA_END=858 /DNA_ORIENTATION=+
MAMASKLARLGLGAATIAAIVWIVKWQQQRLKAKKIADDRDAHPSSAEKTAVPDTTKTQTDVKVLDIATAVTESKISETMEKGSVKSSASHTTVQSFAEPEPEESCLTTPSKATRIAEPTPTPEKVSSMPVKRGPAVTVKTTGRVGSVVVDTPGDELRYKICFEDGSEDWFHEKDVEVAKICLVKSSGRMGTIMMDHPDDELRYKIRFDDGTSDWFKASDVQVTKSCRIRSSGRSGSVVQDHPGDELRYKVCFSDGATPVNDWFTEAAVEIM